LLVDDLIARSRPKWIAGPDYTSVKVPKVSVILPTYSRGEPGMLTHVLRSIRAQTFSDFELIIVDDGSTEGASAIVNNFAADNPNVHVIRHATNLGLPAISSFEALEKARAKFIAFALDDFVFEPGALEALYQASLKHEPALVFGKAECLRRNSAGYVETHILGVTPDVGGIFQGNFIANGGVMLPRSIIDDVGFYDPHLIIARVTDWDLWRRIARRYELIAVDVLIGREHEVALEDSLGNTYELDYVSSREWMNADRNGSLHPNRYREIDVGDATGNVSESTRNAIKIFAQEFAQKHALTTRNKAGSPTRKMPEGKILVMAAGVNASTLLYFAYLPESIRRHVQIVDLSIGFAADLMADCSAVIWVRHTLGSAARFFAAAQEMNVPQYLFVDDNFRVMEAQVESGVIDRATRESLSAESLAVFSGVLVSSEVFGDYLREHSLHAKVMVFPPSLADMTWFPEPVSPSWRNRDLGLVVGFAGGPHRWESLRTTVIPALRIVAEANQLKVTLVVHCARPDFFSDAETGPNVDLLFVPFTRDFTMMVRNLRQYRPSVMVHPPGTSENQPFKTLHPLIVSRLLDCVTVFPFEDPYRAPEAVAAALLVQEPDDVLSWVSTLESALLDDESRRQVLEANLTYCNLHFSGSENVSVLESILSSVGGVPDAYRVRRRLRKYIDGNHRSLVPQASQSDRENHAEPESRAIPIPGPYVERVVEWPGETETLHASIDVLAGIRQYVILEIVHNDEFIVNRIVDSPNAFIPVHSPQLVVPGLVSVRLGSVSEEMPMMITESQLARLDTVIRVWGPMGSPRERTGPSLARRFVRRVRQLARKRT
jgi:glycosyltransferase involved in cell wall biosynthesis